MCWNPPVPSLDPHMNLFLVFGLNIYSTVSIFNFLQFFIHIFFIIIFIVNLGGFVWMCVADLFTEINVFSLLVSPYHII